MAAVFRSSGMERFSEFVNKLPIQEDYKKELINRGEQVHLYEEWFEKEPAIWEEPHIEWRDSGKPGFWHYMTLNIDYYESAPSGTVPTPVQGIWTYPDNPAYFEEVNEV